MSARDGRLSAVAPTWLVRAGRLGWPQRPLLALLAGLALALALALAVLPAARPARAQTFGFAIPIGGTGDFDRGTGIAVDGAGNAYVTGLFRGTVDFDPGPGTVSLTSAGFDDAFVAKYSPSGALLWARALGGPGVDQGNGIAVDAAGNA